MNFVEKIKQGRISFVFLLIVLFLLPLSREFFVIALWPWLFFKILQFILNRGFSECVSWKGSRTKYLLPAFFILLFLSVLWSMNTSEGLDHIGRSALLVIIPLFLGTDSYIVQSNTRIRKLLKSFVLGSTATLLFYWIYALIYSISFENGSVVFNPLVGGWENAFFYNSFSFLMHPTYFGMMVLMAATICLNEIKINNFMTRSPLWPIVMCTVFIISLFFISSRTVIMAAIAILFFFIISRISNKRILIFSLIIGMAALVSMANLHPRFKEFRERLPDGEGMLSYNHLIEVTDRGKIWHSSYLLIKEHFILGVGVGDIRESMIEKYTELGYYSESDEYLNCHNQFIETWLGAGIVSLILLLVLLIYPVFSDNTYNVFLYGGFLIICLTTFLFESVLNRLWGVGFISILYIILTIKTSPENQIE